MEQEEEGDMNTKLMIELFGYLGSALVVVSMLMTSVFKLRIINLTGSVIFAIYALIIKSYPTAFMNFFLVGINIYHLIKLGNTKKSYDLVKVGKDEGFVKYLIDRYSDDISQYFPDYYKSLNQCDLGYVVCCGNAPAGIVLGKRDAKDTAKLNLLMDYSTPVYRDCSVGQFLYERLRAEGFKELSYEGDNPAHVAYVQKMGFEKKDGREYVKRL